ncbi:uncharacterized protein LOC135526929 isoform X2 [Oncorhynchus masou masou]|uniref:uncharacterized protein LOC135526929 isoform X2 n=1 Tax=Oncorhynchus masou masou TaxID=90313 RepID=UPI0031844191
MEARESAPKMYWWGLTGSMAKPGRRPAPTSCGYRGARETGQAPCYTVSPVRVHSPVRYIPAPRIGRARVGIEPSAMKPALRIWSPVRRLGPAYMAPALRMVSLVRLHSPMRAIPPRSLAGRPGPFNWAELQCACMVRSIRYHLHAPDLRWLPPHQAVSPFHPYSCSCLSSAVRASLLSSAVGVSLLSSAAGVSHLSSAARVSRLFSAARAPTPQSRGARAPHSRGARTTQSSAARAFLSSVAGASRLPSTI